MRLDLKGNLAAVLSQRVKSREFLSLTILSETRLRPSSTYFGILQRPQSCLDSATKMAMMYTRACVSCVELGLSLVSDKMARLRNSQDFTL